MEYVPYSVLGVKSITVLILLKLYELIAILAKRFSKQVRHSLKALNWLFIFRLTSKKGEGLRTSTGFPPEYRGKGPFAKVIFNDGGGRVSEPLYLPYC